MLYLTEPIDEVAITNVATFDGKSLIDVSKEDLELGEDDVEESKKVGRALTLFLWVF